MRQKKNQRTHRQANRSYMPSIEALERRDVLSTSSATPYLVPVAPNFEAAAILTVGDTVPQVGGGTHTMVGIPDGIGAFDNGDGTFTLLVNHELGNTAGVVRAHGSKGAFVDKYIIDKASLNVLSGEDLIKSVSLWNTATNSYDTFNAATPSVLAALNRLCSADLPEISAYFNAATGLGTTERIFMNGEEAGNEGRPFGTIVSTGQAFELPRLGNASWENLLANPFAQNKTVIVGTDDTTPGQVYLYVGTKTSTGSAIEKAGLTNGSLFVVKVAGVVTESRDFGLATAGPGVTTKGTFSLYKMNGGSGDVTNLNGAAIDTESVANGTSFLRPEDGAWDPTHPNDFYFVTTDRLDQVADGVGTQVGRSRLWRLHFTDITNPEAGGTIEMVLDGTEGGNMFDNITVDHQGRILLQEDVGNAAHNGKIWMYDTNTDALLQIFQHDPARFGGLSSPAIAPFNQDEESSGIIDVSSIFGTDAYLADVQAHYSTGNAETVEGGQLLLLRQTGVSAGLSKDGNLVVMGTGEDDHISVDLKKNGQVVIKDCNDTVGTFSYADLAFITADGFNGNDHISIDDKISVNSFLRGGSGNDHIHGGGGSDLILGDAGNDDIDGGAGNDILIGGLGRDEINAGKGDDLMIGGLTVYDHDPIALKQIQQGWLAPVSYNTRLSNFRNGAGVPRLDVTTVLDDQVKDNLHGKDGLDWFWAGVLDKVDKKGGEQFGPPAP